MGGGRGLGGCLMQITPRGECCSNEPPAAIARSQLTSSMMIMTWSFMSSDVGLTYKGQTVTNACARFSVALRPQKP